MTDEPQDPSEELVDEDLDAAAGGSGAGDPAPADATLQDPAPQEPRR